MSARKRPAAAEPEPFRKNDTVIGIIGKTHGVSSATSAQPIALRIYPHSEPPDEAGAAAETFDSFAAALAELSVAGADAEAADFPTSIEKSLSPVTQLVSLQAIQSAVTAITAPSVQRTFCANCARPS